MNELTPLVPRMTDDEIRVWRCWARDLLAALQAEEDRRNPFPAVPEYARRVKRISPTTIELTP